MKTIPPDYILSLFHHIHFENCGHVVHHCGGDHKQIDPTIDYTLVHCSHGKHAIDKQTAIGHATGEFLEPLAVELYFSEPCSDGGWHVESGKLAK